MNKQNNLLHTYTNKQKDFEKVQNISPEIELSEVSAIKIPLKKREVNPFLSEEFFVCAGLQVSIQGLVSHSLTKLETK